MRFPSSPDDSLRSDLVEQAKTYVQKEKECGEGYK